MSSSVGKEAEMMEKSIVFQCSMVFVFWCFKYPAILSFILCFIETPSNCSHKVFFNPLTNGNLGSLFILYFPMCKHSIFNFRSISSFFSILKLIYFLCSVQNFYLKGRTDLTTLDERNFEFNKWLPLNEPDESDEE